MLTIEFVDNYTGRKAKSELMVYPNEWGRMEELTRGKVTKRLLKDVNWLNQFRSIKFVDAQLHCIHLEMIMTILKRQKGDQPKIILQSNKIPHQLVTLYRNYFKDKANISVTGKQYPRKISFRHLHNIEMLTLILLEANFHFTEMIVEPSKRKIAEAIKTLYHKGLIDYQGKVQLTHKGKLITEFPYWLELEDALTLISANEDQIDEVINKLIQIGVPEWRIRKIQNKIPKQSKYKAV